VLRVHLPDDRLMRLLEAVVTTPSGRGIPQGGCLSPLLLNVYLHHHLDQPWARRYTDTALIRVADDLLVLCRDTAAASLAYDGLRQALSPAGMPLKGTKDTAICDLGRDQSVTWLGYHVRLHGGSLRMGITDKA